MCECCYHFPWEQSSLTIQHIRTTHTGKDILLSSCPTHQRSPSLYSHFAITMFPTTAKEIKLALLTLWQKSVLKWLLRKKMHSSLSLTVDDSSHSPWYVSCEAVLSRNCSARSAVNRLPYNRHVTWWRTLQAFIGIFCMITQLAETERALNMSTNMQLCTIIWYAMSANPGIWAQRWT